MTKRVALVRSVPDALARCELTHLPRVSIDAAKAREQHAGYERALALLGCEVCRVPATPELSDSAFVEDAAVVLDEVAIITRPGVGSRRGECASVAEALAPYRDLQCLSAPATLDGGDVLRLGHTLYVGVGGRTNRAGIEQLSRMVGDLGYEVRPVEVRGCLHLKSAATELASGLVLVNPAWVDERTFRGHKAMEVDSEEPFAGNVLRIGGSVLAAAAHVRTNARLRSAGLRVHTVDVAELAKAEAGVTCCSLIVECR